MKNKSLFAVIAGTALEFYDITLYGFFAVLLAPLYFPSTNPQISLLVSLGTFAAGFVMRPLGGLFFGYIGDCYGRKKALILAISLVSMPTFIIGFLPTYEAIGIIAPVILIICRLLQGLCVGGEYSGAAVFVSEQARFHQRGRAGGILCSAAFLGAILGSGIGALCTLNAMPSWGWRLPFILGGIMGLTALFYRQNIEESHDFEEVSKTHQTVKFPLKEVWKQNKLSLFCTFAIGGSVQIPYYIVSIYMSLILQKKMGFSVSSGLMLNAGIMIIWMVLLPVAGHLSDRWDPFKLMEFSVISLIILAYPIFLVIDLYPSLTVMIAAQCLISGLGVWYMGVSPSLMPRLFPVRQRMSGMSIAFSLGQAIFSGTTPFIVTFLVSWLADDKAPAFYLIFTSFLGLVAIQMAKNILKNSK
ncbi:MAG: MFS transporter [Janthinobacterium lividum]